MSTTTVITLSELKRKGLSQKDREMIARAECHPDSDCPALTFDQLKNLKRPSIELRKKKNF